MYKGYAVFCLALVLTLLIGCGPVKSEKKNHFVFNQSSALNSLDPANAVTQAEIWAVSQFYNGLVGLDPQLNPIPCLAKRWTISPDGLSYTFVLRPDVAFAPDSCFGHSNTIVTAEDVVYSLCRLLDPAVAAKGGWVLHGRVDAEQPFKIINDSTLIIKLSKPFAPFLQVLSMPYCYIMSKKAGTFYGKDMMKHPVGTGPFAIKMWLPGDVLIGARNTLYFEHDYSGKALPYLDGFSMTQIEDKKTEYLKFVQGDIDIMADIDPAFMDQLLDSVSNLNAYGRTMCVLQKSTFLNTEYIGFNLSAPQNDFLHNTYFRKALAACIDKQSMLVNLRNGLGKPAYGGFVPEGLYGFGNAVQYGVPYNLDSAKRWLKKSGYNNETMRLSVTPQNQALAEYVVKSWELLGVQARVDVQQTKSFRDMMVKGKLQAFRGSWIADYAHPESFLACFFGANSAPPNYTHYRNTQYDMWYTSLVAQTDADKVLHTSHLMDSLVINNAVVVPLFYDQSLTFIQKNIKGLHVNALDMIDLRFVHKN